MILFQNRMRAQAHPAQHVNQAGSGHGGAQGHGGGGGFHLPTISWTSPLKWVAGLGLAIIALLIMFLIIRTLAGYVIPGQEQTTRTQTRSMIDRALHGGNGTGPQSGPLSTSSPPGPVDPGTSLPNYQDGMATWTRTITGAPDQIAAVVGNASRYHFCQGGDFGTSRLHSWYRSSRDGQWHEWNPALPPDSEAGISQRSDPKLYWRHQATGEPAMLTVTAVPADEPCP